jgi:hypothetical protein
MNNRAFAVVIGLMIFGCLIAPNAVQAQQSFVYVIEVSNIVPIPKFERGRGRRLSIFSPAVILTQQKP